MSDELVSVKKDDLRSNRPSLTGNFIVAGVPIEKEISKGDRTFFVINFRLYWREYKKDKGYVDPAMFADAFMFCNDQEELTMIKNDLSKKNGVSAKIHIQYAFPMFEEWGDEKNKRSKMKFRVYAYYPYHLDRDLKKKEPAPANAEGDTPTANTSSTPAPQADSNSLI